LLSSCNIFITKGFIIKEFNSILTPEIKLIIECCKLSQDSDFIESNIALIKDWDDFLSLAHSHGIFPLVYKTLKNYTQIPIEIQNTMKRINMNIVKQNMLMTSELLKVTKLLEENGIEAISFKGPVLSQMAYGDVVSRQYCDLDLLVDKSNFLQIVELLKSKSYSFIDEYILDKIQEKRNIFHDLTMISDSGVNIELHWRLFSDEYMIDFDEIMLLKDLHSIKIQAQNIKTFSNEINLIYLCIHGAKHNWERIEWLVDIMKFIKYETINRDILFNYINKTKTQKIVYSTFNLCSSILDMELENSFKNKVFTKEIIELSKSFEKIFYDDFDSSISGKEPSKKVTKVQFDLLHGIKAKFLFLSSLFRPTEVDYNSIKLSKKLNIFYYFIRIYNITIKKIRNL
jgi:hypothetical protein